LRNHTIKKIIHDINDEPISELISTKAVIDDLNRELKTDMNMSKRETGGFMKKIKKYTNSEEKINDEKIKKYVLETHSKYYSLYKPRQKVFETILDLLTDYKDMEKNNTSC